MAKQDTSRGGPPSLTQWRALFEAADAVKALKPWIVLSDHALLAVRIPQRKEPVFFQTLNQNDGIRGIFLFDGPRPLSKMLRTSSTDDPFAVIGYHDYLACFFTDRTNLEKEDYALIKGLGLKYRGNYQWPMFRALRPGHIPWQLTQADAALLTACLEKYARLYPALSALSVKWELHRSDSYCLFLYKKGGWVSDRKLLSNILSSHDITRLTDEITLARLKQCTRTRARMALDFFNLPVPAQDSPEDIPFYPKLYYLMDTDDELVVAEDTMHPDHSEPALLDDLIQYFLENGLPAILSVRDGLTADILKWLCEQLNIRLRVGADLDLLDELRDEVMCRILDEQDLDEEDSDEDGPF